MYLLTLLFSQKQIRGWAYVPEDLFQTVNVFNVEVKEGRTRSGQKKLSVKCKCASSTSSLPGGSPYNE